MFLLQFQRLLLTGRTSRGTAWSWEFPPSLVEERVYGKTQQLFSVFRHKCAYVLVIYRLCNSDVMAPRDSPTCKKMKCNEKTISHNHSFCSTIMTSTSRNLVLPALSIRGEIKWPPVSKSSRPLVRSDSRLIHCVFSAAHIEKTVLTWVRVSYECKKQLPFFSLLWRLWVVRHHCSPPPETRGSTAACSCILWDKLQPSTDMQQCLVFYTSLSQKCCSVIILRFTRVECLARIQFRQICHLR